MASSLTVTEDGSENLHLNYFYLPLVEPKLQFAFQILEENIGVNIICICILIIIKLC